MATIFPRPDWVDLNRWWPAGQVHCARGMRRVDEFRAGGRAFPTPGGFSPSVQGRLVRPAPAVIDAQPVCRVPGHGRLRVMLASIEDRVAERRDFTVQWLWLDESGPRREITHPLMQQILMQIQLTSNLGNTAIPVK
jgi:hypothetical protein